MIEWLSGSIPDHLSDRQHHRAVHSIGGLFDAMRRTTSPSREGRACRVRAIRPVHTERVEARRLFSRLAREVPAPPSARGVRTGSVPCPSPCRPTASRAEGGAGTARAGPTDATSASLPARPPIDTLSLKPRSGDLIPISIPGLRRRGRLRRRRRWACGRRRPSPCRCGRANRSPRRRPSPRTASSCRGGGSSADTRTA